MKKIFNQVSRVGLFIAGSSLILGTLFGKNVAKKFAGLASGLALLAWGADTWTKRRFLVAIILSAMASGYISYLSYKGAFDSVRLDNVIGNALDGAMKEVGGTLK